MPSRLDVDRQLAADKSAGGAALHRPWRPLLELIRGVPTAKSAAPSPRPGAAIQDRRVAASELQLQRADEAARNSHQPPRSSLSFSSKCRNAAGLAWTRL